MGLKKSLLNYMHHTCLDFPLSKWFDFKVPKTSVQPGYIAQILSEQEYIANKLTTKIVWLGTNLMAEDFMKSHKGEQYELCSITINTRQVTHTIKLERTHGNWLAKTLPMLSVNNLKLMTLQDVKDNYEAAGLEDFELFWDNKPMNTMYKAGLLML
jgi:hypothetical protein